ncbi:hypothetical protein [Cobetia crustatorum]|uniref:hypothetical protein n=1 Tax=Cobetia crustatorum TaxID=553385 RepID=UPI0004B1C6F8|nr:hypothetical protein [Cobetia crustatorum]
MSLESSSASSISSSRSGIAGKLLSVFVWLENLRMDAVLILMRIVIGAVFFMSAQTKVDASPSRKAPSSCLSMSTRYRWSRRCWPRIWQRSLSTSSRSCCG